MAETLNEKKLRKIKEKLKLYWKEYIGLGLEFSNKTREIEEEMNRELDLGFDLEFFSVNGECVGIGASDYSDRETFPLISCSELESDIESGVF